MGKALSTVVVPLADSLAGGGGGPSKLSSCGRCWEEDDMAPLLQLDAEEETVVEEPPQDPPRCDSIIQFSTAQFYCVEGDGEVQVDVCRTGRTDYPAMVRFRTEDGAAKAGLKFLYKEGVVNFEIGEIMKSITIALITNETWDVTLEFKVVLTDVWGAELGKYLYLCQVKIVEDDVFPTNKYESQMGSRESIDKVLGSGLMIEYIRMNLTHRTIFRGVLILIFLDIVKNFYFLLTLYLQLYLVDYVLGSERVHGHAVATHSPGHRRLSENGVHILGASGDEEHNHLDPDEILVRKRMAVAICLFYIIPFTANHMTDYCRIGLGIFSSARAILQVNLLRKFLNYHPDVRDQVSGGDLTMAMTRDVHEVVDIGFKKTLKVLQLIGKLLLALVFILHENKMAAVPLCLFPVLMLFFLWIREDTLVKTTHAAAQAQNELVSIATDAVKNYQTIVDFQMFAYMANALETTVDIANSRVQDSLRVVTNNAYLAPWLTTLLVGSYIAVGAANVKQLGGHLSLGTFLATVQVFKEIGFELQEIFLESMHIQKSYGPLRYLCFLMNLESDTLARMKINRHRRKQGKQRSRSAPAHHLEDDGSTPVFAFDHMEIELTDVNFSYRGSVELVIRSLSQGFTQGRLYAFVGPRRSGKSTLLKLLGCSLPLDPAQGDVFVPPHLRILHVHKNVSFLNASLLSNLIIGAKLESVGGAGRVMEIAELCGFPTTLMKVLKDDVDGDEQGRHGLQKLRHQWISGLTSSDLARVSMARVLITNPECMVLHMPLIEFSDADAKAMVGLLRKHVTERGIACDEEGRLFRRYRTVFFSSSSLARCCDADLVYSFADGGLQLQKDSTTKLV